MAYAILVVLRKKGSKFAQILVKENRDSESLDKALKAAESEYYLSFEKDLSGV